MLQRAKLDCLSVANGWFCLQLCSVLLANLVLLILWMQNLDCSVAVTSSKSTSLHWILQKMQGNVVAFYWWFHAFNMQINEISYVVMQPIQMRLQDFRGRSRPHEKEPCWQVRSGNNPELHSSVPVSHTKTPSDISCWCGGNTWRQTFLLMRWEYMKATFPAARCGVNTWKQHFLLMRWEYMKATFPSDEMGIHESNISCWCGGNTWYQARAIQHQARRLRWPVHRNPWKSAGDQRRELKELHDPQDPRMVPALGMRWHFRRGRLRRPGRSPPRRPQRRLPRRWRRGGRRCGDDAGAWAPACPTAGTTRVLHRSSRGHGGVHRRQQSGAIATLDFGDVATYGPGVGHPPSTISVRSLPPPSSPVQEGILTLKSSIRNCVIWHLRQMTGGIYHRVYDIIGRWIWFHRRLISYAHDR